jgi:hypothetical protein
MPQGAAAESVDCLTIAPLLRPVGCAGRSARTTCCIWRVDGTQTEEESERWRKIDASWFFGYSEMGHAMEYLLGGRVPLDIWE